MTLLLASTSPYRRALLDRLSVPYEAAAPRCDEEHPPAAPEAIASALARRKADSLAGDAELILAGDQVVAFEDEVLGKPWTPEGARAQLARLQGHTHRLVTAVTLRHADGTHHELLDVHRMRMRSLSDDEIERYVARDAPLDCCGAYRIESLGIALFEAIEGDDFTAIMGLPLMGVARLLRDAGLPVP